MSVRCPMCLLPFDELPGWGGHCPDCANTFRAEYDDYLKETEQPLDEAYDRWVDEMALERHERSL